jgi:hypothetical protein
MFYPVKVVGQSPAGSDRIDRPLAYCRRVVAHFCRNTWEIEHKWSMPVWVSAMPILFPGGSF